MDSMLCSSRKFEASPKFSVKPIKTAIIITLTLLAAITVIASLNQPQQITPMLVSLSDLNVEITTTKTVYHVGDVIKGTLWIVNNSSQPVYIEQIHTAYLTAGYVDPPDLHSASVNIDYASPNTEREIPAWGKVGFIPFLFSASQVGTFEIRGYGSSISVKVIDLQYETLIPEASFPEAYSTNMELRLTGVNLPDVVSLANSSGYEVMFQDYVFEWNTGEGTIHTSATVTLSKSEGKGLIMEYDKYANITHVHFSLPANPGETFDLLWDMLARYMHTSRDLLEPTAMTGGLEYSWIDFTISGEPDWDAARADMGSLVERHTRWMGRVFEIYDSDSHFLNMTGFNIIRLQKSVSVGSASTQLVLEVSIDEEGDSKLVIYEPSPIGLPDPSSLFVPMFDSLGLPRSVLEGLKFDESMLFH